MTTIATRRFKLKQSYSLFPSSDDEFRPIFMKRHLNMTTRRLYKLKQSYSWRLSSRLSGRALVSRLSSRISSLVSSLVSHSRLVWSSFLRIESSSPLVSSLLSRPSRLAATVGDEFNKWRRDVVASLLSRLVTTARVGDRSLFTQKMSMSAIGHFQKCLTNFCHDDGDRRLSWHIRHGFFF